MEKATIYAVGTAIIMHLLALSVLIGLIYLIYIFVISIDASIQLFIDCMNENRDVWFCLSSKS